jgi:hypothetical protein
MWLGQMKSHVLLLYVHSENIFVQCANEKKKKNTTINLSFMHSSHVEKPKPCTSDDNYTQVRKNHECLK